MVSSSLKRSPSSPREYSNDQPPWVNCSEPPGSSITPSSDTNSLMTMRPIRALRSGGLRPVVEVDDAVVVGRGRLAGEAARLGVLGEEARPGTAGERVYEEMQPVDQPVREECADERAAAADVEVAVDLVL